jgi:hypothetical protein
VTSGTVAAPTTTTTMPTRAGQEVRVRRTGGIAGRTVEGSIDLSVDSPAAEAARGLVDRIDLAAAAEPGRALPDMFSYTFEIGGRAVTVPQHELSDDQRALVDLLLNPGSTPG